jgi:hypothetical protein
MIGRPRKYESNAAKQREYRLRQKQLRILPSIPNPEPGSLPWTVQYAEAVRRIRAGTWLDDLKRACKESAEAGVREYEASINGDGNGKDN